MAAGPSRPGCDRPRAQGHAHGSSHGSTRIFRVAYREVLYSRLAAASIPLWHELEAESGETLLEQTGQLDHGDVGAIHEIESTLRAGGWAFDRLSPEQAGERWPGMVFDQAVVYSPDGGRVFADRTLDALIRWYDSGSLPSWWIRLGIARG